MSDNTPAAPAQADSPTEGGSYTRDPVTGALTRVHHTLPPGADAPATDAEAPAQPQE